MLVQGLVARGLGRVGESVARPRPRGMVLGRACFGCAWMLFEVGRTLDVAGLPTVVFWFRYLQGLSKFFRFLLRVPLFMVSDTGLGVSRTRSF